MNVIAVILVVISALIHALRNFLTKKSKDKQIFVWCYAVLSLILFTPVFIYFLKGRTISLIALLIGLTAGFIHFLDWFFLSKAYEEGDLSQVYPIMRSAPALVLIFSIVILREQASLTGILGIVSVVIGVYLINKKSKEGFFAIFKKKPALWAFANMFAVASYSIVDKLGVNHAHPMLYLYLIVLFSLIYFTPYILKSKNLNLIKEEWNLNKWNIISSGFFEIAGYALILFAFTLEKVSYVVGLRQLSIVFAVIIGGQILKEKDKLRRTSAAFIIVVGAVLIGLAQ
jgi:uncharacterized membrane protein